MRRVWWLVPALLVVAVTAHGKPFVFTAIPDEDESRLRQRFDKVADYLSGELGVETKYVPVKSYAASITAFRNDQVQLAWFGGLSGVRARHAVPDSRAIAQGYEDQSFRTYFIAHTSTGLEKRESFPMEIEGRTFTFGSKGSTSGRLMPEYHIRQNFGAAPQEVFERVGFSGNHTRTIRLVESGVYQVGAVNFAVWDKMAANGEIDTDQVRIVWVTPPYPDYNWTIRGDVEETWGEGFIAEVKRALLDMDDPALLQSFPRQSFVPASNADYRPIEQTARQIGLMD